MQSVQAGRVTYARAMGPMQFLPGTWARYASDGDGDGKADVAEPLRLDAGRRPVPVQRRPQPARPVAGDDRDPALQQLDGLRPERAGLGGGVRDGRRPGRICRRSPDPPRSATPTSTPTPRASAPACRVNAAGLPATDPLALTPLLPDTAARLGQSRRGRCRGPLPDRAAGAAAELCRCSAWSSSLRAGAAGRACRRAPDAPFAPFAPPPLFAARRPPLPAAAVPAAAAAAPRRRRPPPAPAARSAGADRPRLPRPGELTAPKRPSAVAPRLAGDVLYTP